MEISRFGKVKRRSVGIKFFAYVDTHGDLHVKRVFSEKDIDEIKGKPFVSKVMEPFLASGFPEADRVACLWLDSQESGAK